MIYENDLVYIKEEKSEVPWLVVFTKREIKEFSEATLAEKSEIFRLLDIIEKEMLDYYNPKKINIASFGNMLPRLHWHIMARFENDSYFPEPMWGQVQRTAELNLPSFENFVENLKVKLESF